MRPAVLQHHAAAQHASQKADEDRRVIHDREEILDKRADLANDPDYLMAQQEKLKAWNVWREAKEALDTCRQKKDDSSWR